jgi:hypothetical protein
MKGVEFSRAFIVAFISAEAYMTYNRNSKDIKYKERRFLCPFLEWALLKENPRTLRNTQIYKT